MWVQICNWLYQNALAIFISVIVSLLISKGYYDKVNRESVLMTVIFPIVKLLNQRYYTRKDYEALLEINSSYAVKFLQKKERNKLLELLSAYGDICKYNKEDTDTSCIMEYYNRKLREKGINPKSYTIKDDDGEVVADDFPPGYNYLYEYVYEIVSSYDFIESTEECTAKIVDAFNSYTKKHYTNEKIVYFKDCSIEKMIQLSQVSKRWNDKFKLAEASREEFLKLPICKKVKKILDKSNVNEYVKDKEILERNKEKFTDKVIKEINALKDTKYSSIYVVVCLFEQIVLLELLKDITQLIPNDATRLVIYIGGGFISLIIMLMLLYMLVKKARKQIEEEALIQIQSMEEYVPEKTGKIVECATTIGYMSPFLCVNAWISGIVNSQILKWGFIILVLILGIVIPLVFGRKSEKNRYINDKSQRVFENS